MQTNRIYFRNNPWPDGHALNKFTWSGRLDPEDGLYFDFYLKTDNYNAGETSNEEEEDEVLSDWESKIVWNNYHACTIASKEKGQPGILVAQRGSKFSFSEFQSQTFTADPLPVMEDFELDDLAFGIYLLGHDASADHYIAIERQENNLFSIHWTGKIALFYAGEDSFDHAFETQITDVAFDGIHYPQSFSHEEAMRLLSDVMVDADMFRFEDLNPKSFKREYKLVL
ncbi:hypothetical protein HHL16_14465 [Pseudoflavitalea sp. G-6-1-2]|uniref:hypothetical protein n=1 Tax=Pseudoflavitalea sp. G-6-1-2 TaxID=2728841 RepID=UPI00146BE5AC|nr:hypothetical protein [Pseudoflavitalea sp. G-6-1-2]NML22083.1 hypothetical protein [Pseudoflavitalea sp. G-6-1-2]